MSKKSIKKKYFQLDEDLAYRFELQAKILKTSEVKLVSRYIEEGLRRDENQMTLDDELRLKKHNKK